MDLQFVLFLFCFFVNIIFNCLVYNSLLLHFLVGIIDCLTYNADCLHGDHLTLWNVQILKKTTCHP